SSRRRKSSFDWTFVLPLFPTDSRLIPDGFPPRPKPTSLDLPRSSGKVRRPVRTGQRRLRFMSNRAIWSMRKRHEWLATPLKAKRSKRASRLRNGLQDARDRKAAPPAEEK